MEKSLKQLSWNVPEEVYRKDEALSYSILARYEREGFNNIEHLFDTISSPSLLLGSLVDTYLTEGKEEYDKKYYVTVMPVINEKLQAIAKALFEDCSNTYTSLVTIPEEILIAYMDKAEFQKSYKPETRVKNLITKGAADYYKHLYLSKNKILVPFEMHQQAMNMVSALQESDNTKYFFTKNGFETEIEKLYQLKFKANLGCGISYRCMFDLLIVNHNTKQILPIDLKTTGEPEYMFAESFAHWLYNIQARLYVRVLQEVISKDPYFKDFTILNYKFIVINKYTLCPLVWDFEDTFACTTLVYGKKQQFEFRDPEVIGIELFKYLKTRPKNPMGIFTTKSNSLSDWLNNI